MNARQNRFKCQLRTKKLKMKNKMSPEKYLLKYKIDQTNTCQQDLMTTTNSSLNQKIKTKGLYRDILNGRIPICCLEDQGTLAAKQE